MKPQLATCMTFVKSNVKLNMKISSAYAKENQTILLQAFAHKSKSHQKDKMRDLSLLAVGIGFGNFFSYFLQVSFPIVGLMLKGVPNLKVISLKLCSLLKKTCLQCEFKFHLYFPPFFLYSAVEPNTYLSLFSYFLSSP